MLRKVPPLFINLFIFVIITFCLSIRMLNFFGLSFCLILYWSINLQNHFSPTTVEQRIIFSQSDIIKGFIQATVGLIYLRSHTTDLSHHTLVTPHTYHTTHLSHHTPTHTHTHGSIWYTTVTKSHGQGICGLSSCMVLSGILQLQSLMDKVSVASLLAWLYLVYYSYKVSWTRYLWPIFLHDFIWYATVTKPHG